LGNLPWRWNSIKFPVSSAAGLAVSARAVNNLFLGFQPAVADFSYFCIEITTAGQPDLIPTVIFFQLSFSGITLDTLLVGPAEGICHGQASVLSVICPCAWRHPLQIRIAKEFCLSHWQIGECGRCCPGRFVCEAGATGSYAILPPEDSLN